MPKSRNRKNHSKKVAARRKKISDQRRKMTKIQNEFMMDLIKKELEKGAFDNTKSVDSITSSMIESPSIDSSDDNISTDIDLIDGPII